MSSREMARQAAERFACDGRLVDCQELLSGNINDTYRLLFQTEDGQVRPYTLQRINHLVFERPQEVMQNIQMVTDHLISKWRALGVSDERRVLRVVRTREGALTHNDAHGNCWRMFVYIDGATAYNSAEKLSYFYQTGKAFGEFQRMLCDFPAKKLHETIPGFHNTAARFARFEQAVQSDVHGRVRAVRDEVDFFMENKPLAGAINALMDAGEITLRVTHNDTKMNNVLIDDATGQAICVIDLDTVMPGTALFDYGDAIRYGACATAEDEPNTDIIALDMPRFEQFTQGFLGEVNGFLPERELLALPLGVRVITLELAMRFMTDYLEGDTYFKVHFPGHNLQRARAQMALLRDVNRKEAQMRAFIARNIRV